MSRDFDRAQEMVVASMEYIKVLGFRIRRTEVQRDDWIQVAQSHADEMIKLRQHVDALKAERNAAKQEAVSARQDAVTRAEADRKRIDGLMIQAQDMRAEIERLKKPRQHPVKVGESVRRTTEGSIAPIGTLGRAGVAPSRSWMLAGCREPHLPWAWFHRTRDPPPEASHITPEGQKTAAGAVEPKPGDVVRLIRQCEGWDPIWGRIGDLGTVLRITTYPQGPKGVTIREKGGLDWPLSCVEIVEDAK